MEIDNPRLTHRWDILRSFMEREGREKVETFYDALLNNSGILKK